MNLILLEDEDFVAPDRARLSGRRLEHVREIHRAEPGQVLRVGRIGGQIGTGRILALDRSSLELSVELGEDPPSPSPLTLVLALPRPPILKRVLQQATAMGLKRFVLLHSRRVEKSYWQSHGLQDRALREQLLLGLEQARDTILPSVQLERRFKPFVCDQLAELEGPALVADAEASEPCPRATSGPLTLIVGPEGGFIPYELGLLQEHGARPVALGPRPLRVETAVVALLARLGP